MTLWCALGWFGLMEDTAQVMLGHVFVQILQERHVGDTWLMSGVKLQLVM